MQRREFCRRMIIGVAAGWSLARWGWPSLAQAAPLQIRLALLADAHLLNGDPYRPDARALARAVAEIRALRPKPEVILFAGDLAHNGNPKALALGQEILADLSRKGDEGPSFEILPQDHLWNCPQKQMADPVFTNRPFSCSGKVW